MIDLGTHCTKGLSNSKDPVKNLDPQKISRKNKFILQGWMGLFFLEQIEEFLQLIPAPQRSHISYFFFQILLFRNLPETSIYDTLQVPIESLELENHGIKPFCAVGRTFRLILFLTNFQMWVKVISLVIEVTFKYKEAYIFSFYFTKPKYKCGIAGK